MYLFIYPLIHPTNIHNGERTQADLGEDATAEQHKKGKDLLVFE